MPFILKYYRNVLLFKISIHETDMQSIHTYYKWRFMLDDKVEFTNIHLINRSGGEISETHKKIIALKGFLVGYLMSVSVQWKLIFIKITKLAFLKHNKDY